MNDILTIEELDVRTRIGVSDDERSAEQRILVSVSMTLDTAAAAKMDDVKKSINYADVAEDVKLLAKTERKTIERFAEDIAQTILKKYAPSEIAVTIKKFILPDVKSVELHITRRAQ